MRLVDGGMTVDLSPVGAMIADVTVDMDGRRLAPFFRNPWRGDPRPMDELTRNLGAEWPCVPFGVTEAPGTLPDDWRTDAPPAPWHRHAHGHAAHGDWTLTRIDDRTAEARIEYPGDSPIARLWRRIALHAPGDIRCALGIEVRRAVSIPLGLHPVLSLAGSAPGDALLEIAGNGTAWTFPVDVEPGRSHLVPDQRGVPLSTLAGQDGARVDGYRLPFGTRNEDLVLLTEPGGIVGLRHPDSGYRVSVHWDHEALPCCLLWLSNGGRDGGPWDGRVRALPTPPPYPHRSPAMASGPPPYGFSDVQCV